MRTFLSVFPETTLWWDGSLMIGSKKPLVLRESDFSWKLEARGDALQQLGVTSFEQLKRAYVAGPDEMRAFVGDGPDPHRRPCRWSSTSCRCRATRTSTSAGCAATSRRESSDDTHV